MVWVEVFTSRRMKTWAYYTKAEDDCKRYFRANFEFWGIRTRRSLGPKPRRA